MPTPIFTAFQKHFLPDSLKGKIMLVAFIGIHIPLLGLIGYGILQQSFVDHISFLIMALVATLVGTGATLWILSGLLNPITATTEAVQEYRSANKMPTLPTQYSDEAGRLMANVQTFIQQLDKSLKLKNDLLSIISHDARTPISSICIAEGLVREEME